MRREWIRFLLAAATLVGAPAAHATWSVVITDSKTGEIAIGSATCVTGIDLKQLASVVVVEKGAGAAQSFVDGSGQNRQLIFDELGAGTDPAEILDLLEQQDSGHQTRQYGIADTQGRAVGFTGSVAGAFADHLTGSVGTLTYAIQGNVITGAAVLTEAEHAILTQGRDLPTKLMRAMLAAQAQGGDGRCSCSPADPDGCGTPPPDFDKSADVGYMVVARLGDVDGSCDPFDGCASGDYYLDLNIAFQGANDPDAVFQLRDAWRQWRQGLIGVPDHHRSRVRLRDSTLPANGVSTTLARVLLRDLRGTQITQGGASVAVTVNAASTADVTVGPVIDLGNGSYQFGITAGARPGDVLLDVVVDDGSGPVQLAPRPLLVLTP